MTNKKGPKNPEKEVEETSHPVNPDDFVGDTDEAAAAAQEFMQTEIVLIAEQRGITIKKATQVFFERLRRSSQVTTETSSSRREVLKAVENRRIQDQKRDLIAALTPIDHEINPEQLGPKALECPQAPIDAKFKLQSHALYREMDPWMKVDEAPEYRKAKKDLELLLANFSDILRTVWHKKAKEIGVLEMGPGSGKKIKAFEDKYTYQQKLGRMFLGNKNIKSIPMVLDLGDISAEILYHVFSYILDDIIYPIRSIGSKVLRDDHPWKEFVDFVQKHEKRFTDHPSQASLKVEASFHKLIDGDLRRFDGQPVESIVKYALARYFGFKKVDGEALDELDKVVKLPLEIHPHKVAFKDMDGKRFHTNSKQARVAMHLGDEICNGFPPEGIKELYRDNVLDEPRVINKRKHKQNPDDETNIEATYLIFSFQTGNLDEPNASTEELDAEAARILPAYDNEAFNYFVSHLFHNNNLSVFRDPDTGAVYDDHSECFDIEADFVEDWDNPGYYGTTHHLVFNRDINIDIEIEGKDKFGNIVKDTVTFCMKKGHSVFLLPSYKPTIKQIEKVCEDLDIKVVDVYADDPDGSNAVFLVRNMTEYERDLNRQRKLELHEAELADGECLLDEEDPDPANENGDEVAKARVFIRDEFGKFAKISPPKKRIRA